MSFSMTTSVFNSDQGIPVKHTSDDKDISSPLQWTGIPQGNQNLVLIVDDPDALDPAAQKITWGHWVLYNLSPDSSGLPEAVQDTELFTRTLQGINSWDRTGYGRPCPPIGRHRNFFRLYAQDNVLPYLDSPDKDKLLNSIQGHVTAETVLIGTYQH